MFSLVTNALVGSNFLKCLSYIWLIFFCGCVISVLRDISERGRELEQVLNQYITFVKPAFEEFCLPVRIFYKLCHSLLSFISVKLFSDS